MSADEFERSHDADDGVTEWYRTTDEQEIRGVSVSHEPEVPWPWSIGIAAAEFVREEPYETVLRDTVVAAVRSVPGITEVAEEDREVWLAKGDGVDGETLARAVAAAIDGIAPQMREAFEAW
jgi:hypothetical protein